MGLEPFNALLKYIAETILLSDLYGISGWEREVSKEAAKLLKMVEKKEKD